MDEKGLTMEIVTACCVSLNAKWNLALLMESYKHFNPEFPAKWFVYDNGSTDGALEYAKQHSDLLLLGNNVYTHGRCWTELIRRVNTEFILTVDNDLAFHAPGAMRFMFDRLHPNVYCVCPDRYGHPKGEPFGADKVIEYSPNICCGLFRTEVLQNLCQEFDLGYYINYQTQKTYETGGLIWRVAKTHGLDSDERAELWQYCRHWGQMTTLFAMCPNYPSREGCDPRFIKDPEILDVMIARYEAVQGDLAAIRGCAYDELSITDPAPSKEPVIEQMIEYRPLSIHPFARGERERPVPVESQSETLLDEASSRLGING